MEKVLCTVHGFPCILKTGVRDGPCKGKSFYMCGVQGQASCGFVLPTELCPSHCLVHEEYVVELQILMQQQETDAYRLFYRCSKAKLEGKTWCGNVPWKDSKNTGLSTNPQTQHTLELLFNHRDQRNPFKVPSKNHEPFSLKQMNESENKSSERKDKRGTLGCEKGDLQDFSSESERKEFLAGMKIKNKQFEEKNKSSSKKGIETHTKSSKPATEIEKIFSSDTDECGSSKKYETFSGHTKQDSSMRFIDGIVQKNGRPKESPSFSSQILNTKSLNEDQLKKGGSKTGSDKTVTVKTLTVEAVTVEKPEQKIIMPRELVVAQEGAACSTLPPKGNPEEQLALLQTSKVPEEKNDTHKNVRCDKHDVLELSKLPVGLVLDSQHGKNHSQKNQSSISQETASLQNAETVDSKALHSQLSAQLRQKKSTLKMVNVQALPDKGERLQKQVQELEAVLSSLNLKTEESAQEGDVSNRRHEELQDNTFSKTMIDLPSTVMGKRPQPLQEHRAVNTIEHHPPLGSAQYCSSTYKGDSHTQALYGGRMTEDRLRAVYNATSDAINQLHESLDSCPTEETVAEDPPGLKVSLLLHQKQALAWLLWRENQKPCGGILADDMGLGKTLTMIALLLAQKLLEKEKGKEKKLEIWMSKQDPSVVDSRGTLIVCPASLIHHWKKEVERHVRSGKLKVCLYHGANRNKNAAVLSEYDIVVTTYSILAKEIPTQKEEAEVAAEDHEVQDKSVPFSPLLWIKWARIILDEAHNIKNPKVQASIATCKLRATSRWAVTGTPIQNNLLDMYSLLRFLRCSPFDEFKVWKSQVDNNTRKGGERLTILTKSLLLRRTKNQLDSSGKPLVSLPQRLTRLHRLKLSDEERSVYDVLFARSKSTLQSYLKRQETQSTENSGDNPFDKAQQFRVGQQGSLGKADKDAPPVSTTVHILSLLLRLRQCCCHLSLLKVALDQANLSSEGISLSLEEQLSALTLSEPESSDTQSMVYLFGTAFSVDLFESTRQSTKLLHLLEELKTIQGLSQKSVIVSQWTSMLKVVALHLKKLGLRYATVDGSVNPKQRMDVVEEFNNNPKGPQVMLISLLAGGVGLNLIGGNHLFLFDMHWNPALEDQACDRIYRVGQRNNVMIHRFVCEGTVEENISELQAKKKELAQKVLSGRGDSFTKLTLADLKLLFGI
ncbi:transcription termination factor 2 isoform X3 [Hemicordylus capensis]|uniref:transcription termination factor 2 isoform X3 n=1 Tax=Hemicordylus capensis TaxID=884348 RepID=UPI0023033BB4|nr:transcription termination factor 2 isoform X3 [Hemicordylus capensis]